MGGQYAAPSACGANTASAAALLQQTKFTESHAFAISLLQLRGYARFIVLPRKHGGSS
jgi:hypothetical protein